MGENAVAKVIEVLERELPGFSTNFDRGTDQIRFRGPFWINGFANYEYVVAVPEGREEAFAREVVERTRRHGIEQLGLQATIDELVERGRREGRREGYHDGKQAGIQEGREQLLAEIATLQQAINSLFASGGDDDPRD